MTTQVLYSPKLRQKIFSVLIVPILGSGGGTAFNPFLSQNYEVGHFNIDPTFAALEAKPNKLNFEMKVKRVTVLQVSGSGAFGRTID
jgi:hypothetical protein